MDLIALEILRRELAADAEVVAEATSRAGEHLARSVPGHLEACAYELHRGYNVIEHSLERVCEAFENHFERRGDYHERLLERLSLDLPGLRPAFLPKGSRERLREWKGFRHVVRHAYDLEFDAVRLERLVEIATAISNEFSRWGEVFLEAVTRELK